MILGFSLRGSDPLWQFHVHITLNRCLRVCHYIVDLAHGPTKNDDNDHEESDGKPCHDWSVGFIVVHAKDLFPTMQVQTSFIFLDLIGGDISLATHQPNRRSDISIVWDLRSLDECPMLVFNVPIHLLDYGINKL
jgi:hypothetical protein